MENEVKLRTAYLQGEISGFERAIDTASDLELVMGSQTYDVLYSKLVAKIEQLKTELKALQNEGNN